jgi:hypothetical protein
MDKPTKSVRGHEPMLTPPPPKTRAMWQPLGYEKLDAAQAQSGFVNTGSDNIFYS